ncbi:hypothetical protein CAEBREN_03686 [Caenorhabditis brenneri]|uniref:Uncharacterized protein n=1 Tax=Caenorhabditis brenneri TaxID=135651 RepID=G0N1L4_CAEBE|nr:hypothetical protein CAEBREN_03686 [Caenorhabditis brenneri]
MCRKAADWFPEGNLAAMMSHVMPTWKGSEKFGLEFQNLRLGIIPKAEIELLHQHTWSTMRAYFQLSEQTAVSCVNYYKKYGRVMSVEQLYYVEFGIVLEYPELPLVYICDSGNSQLNGQQFPQEVINIVPLEY